MEKIFHPCLYKSIFFFINLWLSSCRVKEIGRELIRPAGENGHPGILTVWHSDFIFALYYSRHYPTVVMTSPSKDGEWVAEYLKFTGQIPIRGSRQKGGSQSIKQMAEKMLELKCNAGIVADGSRGPARIAQKGAIILSRETGAPIIPTGMAAWPAYRFKNWDKTLLPLPFSRVVIAYGDPIKVPQDVRGDVLEKFRKILEDALNDASLLAERVLKK
jgi:lysophospholipid acyltransferase (LPLAT)-like uncharacterized protein